MILDRIVADSRQELETKKRLMPLADLKRLAVAQAPALDFASALRSNGIRLIAEVKKASPSKGVIRNDFNPVEIARIYASSGAAAISVLTETKYFLGSLEYLKDIRGVLGSRQPPLLRKDFIYDPYQVYESRAYGADAFLLIAAILTPVGLAELLGLGRELGMSCLVEVHNEDELNSVLYSSARIIGINNRDLKTFKVDIGTTLRLRALIPPDRIVVSESGIKSKEDVGKLRNCKVNAVLIGEALITAPDIGAKIKELF
jgi:indole-3-glycerol phosphate synthase